MNLESIYSWTPQMKKIKLGFHGSDERDQSPNTSSREDELISLLHELAPGVCKFLSSQDPIHATRFLSFLHLLSDGSFPIDNICYQIFCDLIQWLSLDDKRQMIYSADVKKILVYMLSLIQGEMAHILPWRK